MPRKGSTISYNFCRRYDKSNSSDEEPVIENLRTTTNFTTTTSVDWEKTGTRTSVSAGKRELKVTRSSYFVRVPSYFEALWYPHLYFDRKSNI